MGHYTLLLVWLGSLLAAAIIGYDRDRWAMGLILGLAFGPLGAIVTGLLPPSEAWEAERRYRIHQHLGRLQRDDRLRQKERRTNNQVFEDILQALDEQVGGEKEGLAEGLAALSSRLEEVAATDPVRGANLRQWITWLNEHAALARQRGDYGVTERVP
jgi:hypothetical protein